MQNLQDNFTINKQSPYDLIVYRGFLCCQAHNFWEPFYKLFETEQISSVIDIGTCHGGTTAFLYDLAKLKNKDSQVMSIDIIEVDWIKLIKDLGVNFIRGDAEIVTNPAYIAAKQLIQSPGKALVVCDGGSKIREMIMYSDLLKSGDIILCHDYAESREEFNNSINKKIWSWCEITYQDIQEVHGILDKHTLYNEFKNCVWGCFVKK